MAGKSMCGESRKKLTERSRAILVVHPNNPTGFLRPAERNADVELALRKEAHGHCFPMRCSSTYTLDGSHHASFAGNAPSAYLHAERTFETRRSSADESSMAF